MWVRLALIAGRVLLRLGLRMAPFLAIGLTAAVRRYRWPLYYRALSFRPARFSLRALPALLLALLAGALALGVLLYVGVSYLAPHG